ncbi:MAG: ABC transporter permease [Pseudolysinimonas sp.]|uniref:ABC transporter permease n=1 Tax=Pseudolysinimonas sp. TaxID=2680009 RepID=UPI003264A6FC
MTTTVATRQPHLTFGGILRSEWIKLRSLRSTLWCYLIFVALTIGFAALVAVAAPTDGSSGGRGLIDPSVGVEPLWLGVATVGVTFGQLVIAVLGALVITGEYGTGMIRSTFAAVPKRLPAIAGKALVFGVVTVVVSAVALIASALISAAILTGRGRTLDLGDPPFWWGILGAIGYLALIGILSLAIGAIIRVSSGSIATVVGIVFIAPIVLSLVGVLTQAAWAFNVAAFLPSNAGGQMYAYEPVASSEGGVLTLDATQGLLVMLAWVVVNGIAALVLVKRRDT